MTRRSFVTLSAAPLAGIITGRRTLSIQELIQRAVLQRFHESIDRYIALRQMAERHLPTLGDASVHGARAARTAAIRSLRGTANIGDVFTSEVTMLFRGRIRGVIADGYDILDASGHERQAPSQQLQVNDSFSQVPGADGSAAVLAALPELPSSLHYRFAGRDLLLLDVDANLVVDILVDAFAFTSPVTSG